MNPKGNRLVNPKEASSYEHQFSISQANRIRVSDGQERSSVRKVGSLGAAHPAQVK
jgi:hypothetical protein